MLVDSEDINYHSRIEKAWEAIMRVFWWAFILTVLVSFSALAQEKVTFPSTDADLKGGTATTLTGYLYKPEGAGPFAAVIGFHGCNGLVCPSSGFSGQLSL